MVNWQFYPKSDHITPHLKCVVDVFEAHSNDIDSRKHQLKSDEVLKVLRADLIEIGYLVEASKRQEEKIKVPVLFGRNGKLEKSFDADAYNSRERTVIEVEAGRAVTNYQFLKDLFQACVMHDVDYLVVAARNIYRDTNKDFETITTFFDTLYASNRLVLPLKGILIVGY
ncbi:MAG: hypothetical protein LBV18_01855 [Alistipes sp.]|jgi:uridine kinase|nr:hypothetical protein [Alistipes sp.]